MSNVLSPERHRELWSIHRSRFVFVASLMLMGGSFLAFLALLPSVMAVYAVGASPEMPAETAVSEQSEEERNEILRAQILLEQFSPLALPRSSTIEAITAALAVRPSRVFIDTITYRSGEKGVLIISGTAAARPDINAFREALDIDERFEGVSVPVASLAGVEEDGFSISLTGDF